MLAGYSHEIEWASNIQPPKTDDDFWKEYAWVVLNSGMKEQIARKIWERLRPAIEQAKPITEKIFRHRGKVRAIQYGYLHKHELFFKFYSELTAGTIMEWLQTLDFIGPITVFHLAKNLGVNIAKPDRHLVRISGQEGTQAMCERIAKQSGDKICVVDSVIWRAANLGII